MASTVAIFQRLGCFIQRAENAAILGNLHSPVFIRLQRFPQALLVILQNSTSDVQDEQLRNISKYRTQPGGNQSAKKVTTENDSTSLIFDHLTVQCLLDDDLDRTQEGMQVESLCSSSHQLHHAPEWSRNIPMQTMTKLYPCKTAFPKKQTCINGAWQYYSSHGKYFACHQQASATTSVFSKNSVPSRCIHQSSCIDARASGDSDCMYTRQAKRTMPWMMWDMMAIAASVRWASTTTTRDKLRKRIRDQLPELKEEELEETFVRGSGPGGQATNKTSNCVVLKHIPTSIIVKCHQTRSQSENQKIARLLMRERLDQHLRGDESALAQLQRATHKKREEKKRRTRQRLERLRELRASLEDEEGSGEGENGSGEGQGPQGGSDVTKPS